MADGTWICPTTEDRERFCDLHRRLQAVNQRLLVVLALCIVPLVATLEHPLEVSPALAAIIAFAAFQRIALRFPRPELWTFFALLGAETGIALAALLATEITQATLALMCWPAAGIAGRFRDRPVRLATLYAITVMVVASVVADGAAVLESPLRVVLVAGALVCVTSVVLALRDSDIEHRGAAAGDELTGMLNRSALQRRVSALEAKPALEEPLSVLMVDIDFFKLVNDRHGHATGDEILREMGALLRSRLRTYDLAYRLGGEEFVVLLPGAGMREALERAEDLRRAVAEHPFVVPVTASIGVSACPAGRPFDWAAQFEDADQQLYAAKRAGRNRVAPPLRSALATAV